MRTRPLSIGLWLHAEERAHLLEQFACTALTAIAYLRKRIMGESLRPRPPDAYTALLRELSALGNNVNQLARQANTRGKATRGEISQAAELVREAYRLVKGWR